MSDNKADGQYEVLNPWAKADPVPLRGLTAPRVTDLDGKKIGLFRNVKRAGEPILNVIESRLRDRYPKAEFSRYIAQTMGVAGLEPQNHEKFEGWIKEVDAVILAVAD